MDDRRSFFIPKTFSRQKAEPSFTDSERRILSLLRQEEGLSRAELARRIGLSNQAVIKIIDNLMILGLVCAGERVVAGPGQPSVPMSLSDNAAFGFGVSLQNARLTLVLASLTGKVFAQETLSVSTSDRQAVISALKAAMAGQVSRSGVPQARIFSLGFAASGFFVGRAGQLNAPRSLEAWALRDLEGELSQAFALPVWVENDGSAAAVGESLYGTGHTCGNFAYIHIDQGLGGGVIAGNRLWRGANGNAGEFTGLLPPSLRQARPTLPLLKEVLRAHGVADERLQSLSSTFDLSWPGVEAWLERVHPALTQILAAIAAVHDPEAIVIGGNLPPPLVRVMAERATFYEVPVRGLERPFPAVIASQAEGDAVAFGAAALPFMHHFF